MAQVELDKSQILCLNGVSVGDLDEMVPVSCVGNQVQLIDKQLLKWLKVDSNEIELR